MQRIQVGSGAPWEAKVGYSRAVRVGQQVWVTGTIALGEGGRIVGRDDVYRQTHAALDIIERALVDVGATLEHVVRTRIYVTDIKAQWEAVGRAHAERLGHVKPATTMVEVARLIAPDALVEVEVDALIA